MNETLKRDALRSLHIERLTLTYELLKLGALQGQRIESRIRQIDAEIRAILGVAETNPKSK